MCARHRRPTDPPCVMWTRRRKSRSILSKFLLECDIIQKLSVHTKLHIRCAFSPLKSNKRPMSLCFHFSSTEAGSCAAIICHNLGASTLPWRRHRLRGMSSPRIRKSLSLKDVTFHVRTAINHPCWSWLSQFLQHASTSLHRKLS